MIGTWDFCNFGYTHGLAVHGLSMFSLVLRKKPKWLGIEIKKDQSGWKYCLLWSCFRLVLQPIRLWRRRCSPIRCWLSRACRPMTTLHLLRSPNVHRLTVKLASNRQCLPRRTSVLIVEHFMATINFILAKNVYQLNVFESYDANLCIMTNDCFNV